MMDREDEVVPEQTEDTSTSAVDWLEAIAELAIDALFFWL